jgi:hypothetical protein
VRLHPIIRIIKLPAWFTVTDAIGLHPHDPLCFIHEWPALLFLNYSPGLPFSITIPI